MTDDSDPHAPPVGRVPCGPSGRGRNGTHEEEARSAGATLVTTEKDAARLGGQLPSGETPTVLRIEVEVDTPEVVDRVVASALERTG